MGARGSNRGHGTVSEQRRRPQGKAGKLRRHVGVGTWTYRTWPASSRFQAAPTILPPHIHLASRHLGVFLTVSLLYNLLSLSSIRYVTWSSPVPGRRHCAEIRTRRLADGAGEVFVLDDVEGYKHEEIADMLGIVPGTSKSQLHHARMALRKHLE